MKFLVYIPCHSDMSLALDQAEKLKVDFTSFQHSQKSKSDELQIVISVNAYEPNEVEKLRASEITSDVIYFGASYLADINIANGFLVAIEKKPDFLWILSANDALVKNSIGTIMNIFNSEPDVDLIVANALNKNEKYLETQIINPPKVGSSYGVISGVAYKLEKLLPYFHNGPFMAWTGWSHLAVMQSAMNSLNGLIIRLVPDHLIYTQKERDLKAAGRYYAHSLYGMLILGFTLDTDRRRSRSFIRKYVFKNFYNFHLYSREWKNKGELIDSRNYLAWNQGIAESLVAKKTPLTYLFYQLFKLIPWENFSNVTILIKIKKFIDRLLRQSKVYEWE